MIARSSIVVVTTFSTFAALAALAALGVVAACADSEEPVSPAPEPTPSTVLDAGAPDVDVPDASQADAAEPSLPTCSDAGWCITPFPDEDLVFRDIWPLGDRAFAVAESRVEGVKALEWQAATQTWQYIDDQTQNGAGAGTFAGRVYAPNADEVYFTVGPAFVYHGTRPVPPATTWTWTRSELPDNVVGHPSTHDHGNPYYNTARTTITTLGVWGTGADDVYAYYSNTIFHRDPVDGTWSAVYVASDLESADEHVFIAAVSGTGPNDIWFAGARDREYYNCPFAVRKTESGFLRVADGVVHSDPVSCTDREGVLRIGGTGGGWLVDIQAVSPTEVLAVHNANKQLIFDAPLVTRLRDVEGAYSVEQSKIPIRLALAAPVPVVTSLWRGTNLTWFTSFGLVVQEAGDGDYGVSTLSRDGAPVSAPLYRIRGTSDQDIWAIGARHAYHKTTP